MSLLRDIQAEISQSNSDLLSVLRKCKILAARLGSIEFAQWVEWELGGYPADQEIPSYRHVVVTNHASFYGIGWRVPKAAIPIQIVPEKYRESFSTIKFSDGITKAISLANTDSGRITIQRSDLIFAIQGKMYPEMECHNVWGEISAIEFQQLVSAVGDRILGFILQLEKENPSAGEAPPNTEPVPREKLIPMIQNIFHGSVGAVAQNSEHFSQNASLGMSPQELSKFVAEFRKGLGDLNLDSRQERRARAQLATLETEASSEPDPAIVRQAARTLRNITEGAIGSLVATAVANPTTTWHWINEILKTLAGNSISGTI